VAARGSKAPFVVFGGMIAIGLTGLLAVLISDCMRDEPYMDPVEIRKGSPDRVPPPPPVRP
jgi:hypothetical protein